MNRKNEPAFVAISDIHFNLNNLHLSSQALTAALKEAEKLKIPLVIAGDLNDTKAIIRAEVANEIISILGAASVPVFVLVGNHDLVNERGQEHGLNYLKPYVHVIDFPCRFDEILPGVLFVPYQNHPDSFYSALRQKGMTGDIVVAHQGVLGSSMGDYIQDKSAINPENLPKHQYYSGHYHEHQTIVLRGGSFTYMGSPFTMTFGEANDGLKGFLIVYKDGTFKQHVLGLRRHVVESVDAEGLDIYLSTAQHPRPGDLLWLKVTDVKSKLATINKAEIAKILRTDNFKLDKIEIESTPLEPQTKPKTDTELLDALIDTTSEDIEHKSALKALWRELLT